MNEATSTFLCEGAAGVRPSLLNATDLHRAAAVSRHSTAAAHVQWRQSFLISLV